MAIPVYSFGVQVLLRKVVRRTNGVSARYQGSQVDFDLTPYLGQAGAVETMKSLAEPAGAFTVTVADKMRPDIQDSIYAAVEPMDMIEIRASQQPFAYAGAKLPLIMRGFVTAVKRRRRIGDDGRPQRVVTISGHDSGKLLQIFHFIPQYFYAKEKTLISVFNLITANGLDATAVFNVADFMKQVIEKIINLKIATLYHVSGNLINPFSVNAQQTNGVIFWELFRDFQGPYWNLLNQFADRPWNELFVSDTEAGPVLNFRPTPYRDLDMRWIIPGATDPGTITIPNTEVLSIESARSDSRVANFFWVDPGPYQFPSNAMVTAVRLATGAAIDDQYGNDSPDIYGLKMLQASSNLHPSSQNPATVANAQQPAQSDQEVAWVVQRSSQLMNMNRDNVVFEDVDLTVRGNENMTIGIYARLIESQRDGGQDVLSNGYIETVMHRILPLRTWETSARLVRADGFANRNIYTESPYLSEGIRGPYTP